MINLARIENSFANGRFIIAQVINNRLACGLPVRGLCIFDDSPPRMLAGLEGVPLLFFIRENENDREATFSLTILMRAG